VKKGVPEFDVAHQIHLGWRSVSANGIAGFLGSHRQIDGCFFPLYILDYPMG